MGGRILIVDDHPLIAAALTLSARTIDAAIGVDIAETLGAAEAHVREERYDLVLLDLVLPDAQGFAGLSILHSLRPDVPIAIVTSRTEPTIAPQALALGARGFLNKSTPIDEMATAISILLQGGLWFPEALTLTDSSTVDQTLSARIRELSHAQLKVLNAIAGGRQNKQIADDLGIAEPTVKSHLASVFKKLGVTNRTQAVLALRAFDAEPVGQSSSS